MILPGHGLRVRSALIFLLLGAAVVAALAPPAHAGRLLTWKTHSRHVDPAQVEFGRPPLCSACAPHAKDGLYVNVWLPDGYNGRRRFPVLYLLHGGDAQYDFWLHSPRPNDPRGGILPGLAADFPGIIVMPDGGADGHYMNWRSGQRGNPAWERYHLDELIPLVERRLKVRRGRRHHAIAGFSLGGYGAAFYASQRPGYFGLAAALSARLSLRDPFLYPQLSYALGDPVLQRFYWVGHDPVALAPNLRWTRLYVSVGDGNLAPGDLPSPGGAVGEQNLRRLSERFVAAARDADVAVRFKVRPGIHNHDVAWRSFADAFPWIAANFGRALPDDPTRWIYRTVARESVAFGFRFSFATAPRRLAWFARHGRILRGRGAGRVSVTLPAGRTLRVRLPFEHRLR
jgi:S-formylglutathione hydrolase FrmB